MERDVAERFERIEANLVMVVESQASLQQLISGLVQTVTHYVDASDARMKRMEENLDMLIRAIAAEHANGRGKAQ